FYAVKTAAAVADGYSYNVDSYFLAGCLAAALQSGLILFMLWAGRKKRHTHRGSRGSRWLASLAGIAVSVLFVVWINFDAFFFRGISQVTWDHNIGINDYGYLLYFLSNA
ncbi:MAG TPA: hypothetical protein DCZ23_07665, partial [Lachnospiraceae bacterium]|nr:hypothetical protein [Lachnospiraceae bacterium]